MIGVLSRSGMGYRSGPRLVDRDIWLPECKSLRTRLGRIEPEIHFRIVYNAQVGHPGAPVAAFREQTVDIALGPKGAFEDGYFRAVSRQVATAGNMNVALMQRGKPKSPKEPRTPRVVEFLRKAIVWRRQIDVGEDRNQAVIARREGITRARVTQLMRMLRLAPEIQEQILAIPDGVRRPPISERMLRPIEAIADYREQRRKCHKLLAQAGISGEATPFLSHPPSSLGPACRVPKSED